MVRMCQLSISESPRKFVRISEKFQAMYLCFPLIHLSLCEEAGHVHKEISDPLNTPCLVQDTHSSYNCSVPSDIG
jgi:hypothetical protein